MRRSLFVLSVPEYTSQYLPKVALRLFPSIFPRPNTILAGLMVVDMPFLLGMSLRQAVTIMRHSSIMVFGTFLNGRETQKQRVLSFIYRILCSMRGICWGAAQISTCADILFSSFVNSLSALIRFTLKPRFLKMVRTFSIPLMMSLGPRLYVVQSVFFLRVLMLSDNLECVYLLFLIVQVVQHWHHEIVILHFYLQFISKSVKI